MGNKFDGRDFVGLVASFFGDGRTNIKPLSTYKENRINANIMWLCRNRLSTGYSVRNRPDTPRLQGSLLWGTRFLQRIILYPNDTLLTVHCHASVMLNGAVGGSVEARARVLVFQGGEVVDLIEPQTMVWDKPRCQIFEIDVTSNPSQVGVPVLVSIETRSIEEGTVAHTAAMSSLEWSENVTGNAFKVPLGWTVGPDQFVRLPSGDHDILGTFANDEWIALQSSTGRELVGDYQATAGNAEVVNMSVLNVRGWYLYSDSDPKKPMPGLYTPKSQFSMRAGQIVKGEHTAHHGSNLDGMAKRSRTVAMGPGSGESYGATWPSGQFSLFKYLRGDQAAMIDFMGMRIDYPRAVIRVTGFVSCVDAYNLTDNNMIKNIVGNDERFRSLNVRWPVNIRIRQLQNGQRWHNASEIASRNATIAAAAWQVSPSAYDRPFLRAMHLATHDDSFEFAPGPDSALEYTGEPGFHFFEGQLAGGRGDEVRDDLRYLTPFSITFNVEGVDKMRPFRIDLNGAEKLTIDDVEAAPGKTLIDFDPSRLFMCLVSWQVDVRPLF